MESGNHQQQQQRWNNRGGRSNNRKPPRAGNRQPTVPSWEKLFCEAVGNLDWETLMQMKKCMHFYENVIQWDDSAGQEAFCNAKQRFWAHINGFPCDISLPDPDLYIDEINWDPEIDLQLHNELMTSSTEDHEDGPVIIFGDALLPSQEYTATGWGDNDDNFMVPVDPWEQNWGVSPGAPTGWDDNQDISNSNNNVNHEVGPRVEYKIADVEQGAWDEDYVAWADAERHVSSYRAPRVQGNDQCRNRTPRYYDNRHKGKRAGKQSGTEKRGSSFNSWGRRNNSWNNVEPK